MAFCPHPCPDIDVRPGQGIADSITDDGTEEESLERKNGINLQSYIIARTNHQRWRTVRRLAFGRHP